MLEHEDVKFNSCTELLFRCFLVSVKNFFSDVGSPGYLVGQVVVDANRCVWERPGGNSCSRTTPSPSVLAGREKTPHSKLDPVETSPTQILPGDLLSQFQC